jgi:hypothetical protein
VQCRDCHISTCLIKTLMSYLCCAYCALCHLSIHYLFVVVCYLFICACYSLLSFILFIVRLLRPHYCLILFFCDSFAFIILYVWFKENRFNSILILDCIPGISILLINNCTTSSMQVNKHHTAECTDFVLV